ncbi:hypothetical protein D0Y83_07580 [Qipengyuania flava]|uniref:Uncharacterized protein n=2 Tax=Qipengyuania flava TaxID=192812 RepID=A0A5P6NB43_9SPHN|nr:hypothetical protein D0Y83_07580 [Qipengyuania flava]
MMSDRNAAAMEQRMSLVKISLVGTFGYFAAIFSDKVGDFSEPVLDVMVWAPLIFNTMSLILEENHRGNSRKRGDIMKEIETLVLGDSAWRQKEAAEPAAILGRGFADVARLFWITMVILSLLIAFAQTFDFLGAL